MRLQLEIYIIWIRRHKMRCNNLLYKNQTLTNFSFFFPIQRRRLQSIDINEDIPE